MHIPGSNEISFSNLRKFAFICGCLLLYMSAGGRATSAQHGGKAEPNRIEFKRGTHSATIDGIVRGDEQAEYVLGAKEGQTMVIKITSVPAKSSVFQVVGPDKD